MSGHLPALIEARLEQLSLSEEAAGHAMGVFGSTVHRWRTGQSRPQLSKVPAVAEWLGITEAEVRDALRSSGAAKATKKAAGRKSVARVSGGGDEGLAELVRGLRGDVATLTSLLAELVRRVDALERQGQRPPRRAR